MMTNICLADLYLFVLGMHHGTRMFHQKSLVGMTK